VDGLLPDGNILEDEVKAGAYAGVIRRSIAIWTELGHN
jgi:hypothetical protein